MRFLHLSDLHIGKNISNYSLIEDQKYALEQIIDIANKNKVELVIIAGDVYDKLISSNEALELYEWFIEELIFKYKIKVIAIAGNHDSHKRLSYSKKFFEKFNYFVYGEYSDTDCITLEDEYGKINFYPISYISIQKARTVFKDKEIENYSDLYNYLLESISYNDRNVLITHCYASETGYESENAYDNNQKPLTIGGNDAMDAKIFKNFDYVALGHLHRAHYVLDEKIRYSGTFMKYSFSEVNDKKTITLVDLTDKLQITKIPIKPLRDFKIINDYFENILNYEKSSDYIQVVLKDEAIVEDAINILKSKFDHIVNIIYEKRIINNDDDFDFDIKGNDTLSLFDKFYKYKMDRKIEEHEQSVIKDILEDINETNKA
ncbi:MAG: exonuclease SbcCD subunit D [Tissierellia bacterium]|nr:exonuclease SbcCD subunit D [Tissierellia bacterium]